MQPTVGMRVRVVGNTNDHSYDIGGIYTVTVVDDSDNTCRAADATGEVRNWLRWGDCEPAEDSLWDQLAPDLPEELVLFLASFDGIASIKLKEQLVDEILAKLPDLHERILSLARTPDGAALIKQNLPRQAVQGGGEG